MSWWALDIRPPAEGQQALAAWLVAKTGKAVEVRDDGTLVTFAPDESTAEELVSAIADRDSLAAVSRRPLEERDWATRWREGLGPRHLGRLTLIPSWIEYAPGPAEITVVLDPETAFGSGEHGSTRAALHLLERHLPKGGQVLDLGSGSGILAIAACRLGAGRAIGIEIDEEALPVAWRNALRNRVDSRVEFICGDAADLAPLLGPADLICSNILRGVNLSLLPTIAQSLAAGGQAIFSGMEESEAGLFLPQLTSSGWSVIDELVDAGWWAVIARAGC